MSSLIGAPGDRWPLRRAIDALGDAARQAGRPGLVWVAGLFYPSLGIGAGAGWFSSRWRLGSGWGDAGGGGGSLLEQPAENLIAALGAAYLPVLGLPFVAVLFLPLFRLVAGLARAGSERAWDEARGERRTPPLRALWRLGKGLMLGTYGLWLQLVLMQIAAVAVLLVPAWIALALMPETPFRDRPWAFLGLGAIVGPFVLLLACYTLALSVLGQLSLQSLVENRRGVSSALLHAWRIMRHDPWATARAVLSEVILLALTFACVRAFAGILYLGPEAWPVLVLELVLAGFAGAVRAGYWARAYRALGGLSAADGVPGLVPRI